MAEVGDGSRGREKGKKYVVGMEYLFTSSGPRRSAEGASTTAFYWLLLAIKSEIGKRHWAYW